METTNRPAAEKTAALDAFFFCLSAGDSQERAEREVCIEFGCTPAELHSWDIELEYIPG